MTRRFLWHPCLALAVASLFAGLLIGTAAASPGHSYGHAHGLAVDSDGDGIPDDMDPDDNNNGVLDGDEGVEGSSPPNDPLPDSDSDGITNDMDPDDDNNAVTDENEPVPPPPASESPGSGNTSNPDTSSNPVSPPASSGSNPGQPIVNALPVTGAGATDDVPGWYTTVFISVSVLLFAGGAWCRLDLGRTRAGT